MKKLYFAGIAVLMSIAQPALAFDKDECIKITRSVIIAFDIHVKNPTVTIEQAKNYFTVANPNLSNNERRVGNSLIDIAWVYPVDKSDDDVSVEVFMGCLGTR